MCMLKPKNPSKSTPKTRIGYKLYNINSEDGTLTSLCQYSSIEIGIQQKCDNPLYGFHCFSTKKGAESFFQNQAHRSNWRNLVLVRVLCTNVLKVGRDGDTQQNGWCSPSYDKQLYTERDRNFAGYPAFTAEYMIPLNVVKKLEPKI